MPKRSGPRKISFLPDVTYFKPAHVRMAELEEVELQHDEVEAIRLKHLVRLGQDEAARHMGVSQPTFHRLLSSAHEKLAEAVIKGKALRIEGGNVTVQDGFQAARCGRPRDCGRRPPKSTAKDDGGFVSGTDGAIVAVASVDGTLEGSVNERFGRCKKLVIYDGERMTFQVMDNSRNMGTAQGAGIQTAQSVIEVGARTVISGHFGPKAFQVLNAAGIEVYSVTDNSVAEALRRFHQGQLERLGAPDVDAHW
jgi:predicted DNA-binding protein (UPF0251 family)/predicted Fe-Mo cluster-binding NifX family protein